MLFPLWPELRAIPYEAGRTLSGLRRRRGKQSCKIAECSGQHGRVEYCNQCQEFPCNKYGRVDEYDIFITHRNWKRDFEKIKGAGVETYNSEQRLKLEILKFFFGTL